ncbi:MAG: glycosyltransferase family 2 protein [Alphaproteobacteria bacterium]|nr:glycosyltransferase family 2 protein [Alphaproteobacteria bacterium]
MPKITIVIATYNRPQLLRSAIQSILNQTEKDWILLIVGDSCSAETAAMIADIGDDRIFYVNLPVRCGEQAGPNTAGMLAARSPYVAFANHDDIWLPDHLERALSVLENEKAKFYVGGAVIAAAQIDAKTGKELLTVKGVSPKGRTVAHGMNKNAAYFEPVSSWVIKRDIIQVIGGWSPACTIYRTPAENWIMRAWRAGIDIYFDDVVTVFYCTGVQSRQARGEDIAHTYTRQENEPEQWLQWLTRVGVDVVRQKAEMLAQQQENSNNLFPHLFQNHEKLQVFQALQRDEGAFLFQEYGWDGFSEACKILGILPGFQLRCSLKQRTGETLLDRENWKDVSLYVAAQLAENPMWCKVNKL